jgi:uncharacterized membrane protein YtjA (UPF0391 family)
MLYYLAFLLVALAASFLLFRLVALAATEIARVFLFLFLMLSPVTLLRHFVRARSR